MSGVEVTGLITRIDESIADSDRRIQDEIAEYVESHPDDIGLQIANHGFAKIPTFAGDYTLTEEQLREIAGVAA
jgi:hypothetical protein